MNLRLMPIACALALVPVLAAPAAAHHEADPSAPYDFRNAEASAFGGAELPAYLDAPAGEPVELAVPIVLHPEELERPAFRYLVGFNLPTDSVRIDDVALTRGGKPVPFERDETDRELQPRFILRGNDLPRDGAVELLLAATATPAADGRLHVGVLAIAFDAAWGTLRTQDGAAAQAYAFTLLMADGHAATGLAPRFTGQGNAMPALAPLGLLALATGVGLHAAWRRLHPAPPKGPKPAKQPKAKRPRRGTAPALPARRAPVTIVPHAVMRPPRPASSPAAHRARPSAPLATQEFSWVRSAAAAPPPMPPPSPAPPVVAPAFTAVKRPKRPARQPVTPAVGAPVLATTSTRVVARRAQ